jgi:hypothetical protein
MPGGRPMTPAPRGTARMEEPAGPAPRRWMWLAGVAVALLLLTVVFLRTRSTERPAQAVVAAPVAKPSGRSPASVIFGQTESKSEVIFRALPGRPPGLNQMRSLIDANGETYTLSPDAEAILNYKLQPKPGDRLELTHRGSQVVTVRPLPPAPPPSAFVRIIEHARRLAAGIPEYSLDATFLEQYFRKQRADVVPRLSLPARATLRMSKNEVLDDEAQYRIEYTDGRIEIDDANPLTHDRVKRVYARDVVSSRSAGPSWGWVERLWDDSAKLWREHTREERNVARQKQIAQLRESLEISQKERDTLDKRCADSMSRIVQERQTEIERKGKISKRDDSFAEQALLPCVREEIRVLAIEQAVQDLEHLSTP